MSHRYTLSYRRATLGDSAKTTEDSTFQEHVIGDFPPGTSRADRNEYWKQQGEEELRLLERNASSLRRRPASPDLGTEEHPFSTEHKQYAPRQPLTAAPRYEHYHVVSKFGPPDQWCYYQNGDSMRARSGSYIRFGLAFYFVRLAERINEITGSVISPNLHRDTMGRFQLISQLYKDDYPEVYRKIRNGVEGAANCLDYGSPHFRGDLLQGHHGNFKDQDFCMGFLAMIGKYPTPSTIPGADPHTTRGYDVILRSTTLERIFPRRSDRDNCRWFMGVTSADALGSQTILSLQDFFFQAAHLAILPKREVLVHVITAYNSGRCIGTMILTARTKKLVLKSGESYITSENYKLKAKQETAGLGPVSASTGAYKPTLKSLKDQQLAAIESQQLYEVLAEKDLSLFEVKKRMLAAHKAQPATDQAARAQLAQYFNTKLEKILARRVIENPDFMAAFKSHQLLLKEFTQAASEGKLSSDQLTPAANHSREGKSVRSKITQSFEELERQRILIILDKTSAAAQDEATLRNTMRVMGFQWTRPGESQVWTVIAKQNDLFLGCTVCHGRLNVTKHACPCLREWMRQRRCARDDRCNPVSYEYKGCSRCKFDLFAMRPFCSCMDATIQHLEQGREKKPCILCLSIADCDCPLVTDIYNTKLSKHEQGTPLDDLTMVTNPDFGGSRDSDEPPSYQELSSAEVEELARTPATPDTWAACGKLPGHLPENHVRYPRPANKDDFGYSDPPPLPEDAPGRQHKQGKLQKAFERSEIVSARTPIVDFFPSTSAEDVTGYKNKDEDFRLRKKNDEATPADLDARGRAELDMEETITEVEGLTAIPRHCFPFDARSHGRIIDGIPQHYNLPLDDEQPAFCPTNYTLYNTPLASSGLKLSNPKFIRSRYLAKNSKGKYYNPLGTCYKILRDTCGIQRIQVPHGVGLPRLQAPTGEEIYNDCQDVTYIDEADGKKKTGNRTALSIHSMQKIESTDVPDGCNRAWLYTLSLGDSHGTAQEEFLFTVVGMFNYFSRQWEEKEDTDGQRYLSITLPGRNHGSFALSVGGIRPEITNFWKTKIAGRSCISILCGAGTISNNSDAAAAGASEQAAIQYDSELESHQPTLVKDTTPGAGPESMRLSKDYRSPSPVGLWRRLPEDSELPGTWQRCLWPGFGFEFSDAEDGLRGHRVLVTMGKRMNLQKLQCLQGLCYWIMVKYPFLQESLAKFCVRNKLLQRKNAFKGSRFSVAFMPPTWCEYMDNLKVFFGDSWEQHFEELLFRLQCDYNDGWLEGSKDGPMVAKFLHKDGDPLVEETEEIGRINELGQYVAMGEEIELNTNWPGSTCTLPDYGHYWAAGSTADRPQSSTKPVSTREFLTNETL
ncbi:unnamed protein product [Oikopleura dioica]|uniref:Uncharacterized protein n=1 Tax=Oikopleura dioica TaxID=34765 RepID=E4XPL9_OIKDI|nr:unnamed protein product [Oikopleura dioica]